MTTNYALTDAAPKDSGGQKFISWPNPATSQNDFSLPMGIGASTIGNTSKIHSYLAVATTIAASPINNNAVAGMLQMVAFTANASNAASNNAFAVRGTDRGEIFTTGLSATASLMSGSREVFTLASGLLYRVMCAGCGVIAGGQVAIMNGGTSLMHFVFSGANETLPIFDAGNNGACFSSLRLERINTVGDVYVSALWKSWGQG